jgi:polyphosphate kinase
MAGTAAENALRFEVPSAEVLQSLATTQLPLGLKAARPTRSFHRDIYLDTPDGELQRRGLTCRFRIGMDDRRTLRVVIRSAVAGGVLVEYDYFEAEVPEVDPLESLRGSSEPARRLRAVTAPGQLGIRIELQTERISRTARPRWLPIKTLDIAYDTIAVHSGGLSRTFHEVRVRRLAPGGPSVDELGGAFQHQHGLHPMPCRRVERAEELLSAMEAEGPAEAVTGIPELAVIAVADGRVAMHFDRGMLRLPVGEGKGEKSSRRMVDEVIGSQATALDLLGTVAASPSAAAMEVWLARCGTAHPRGRGSSVRWVSFADVLSLVGAPVLRDGRTLAALSLAARNEDFDVLGGLSPGSGTERGVLTRAELRESATRPRAGQPPTSQRFLNDEISLLEFNGRVLELAEDPTIPLLARTRFLAIYSSNTDEFFMVKVGGLKRLLAAGKNDHGEDGLGVHERMDAIAVRLRQQLARARRCLDTQLAPRLAKEGIRIVRWAELQPADRAHVKRYYEEQVFPLLTAHAVTRAPGHPFPHIENLRLSVAAIVRDEETGRLRFGVTTLPLAVPRFAPLPDGRSFVPLEDIVRANLAKLYPGRRVESAHCFRVTRIGDLDLDEEGAEDLLDAVEEQVRRRPFAGVVRLEVERSMPPVMRDLLLRELQMVGGVRGTTPGAAGIYEFEGLLDLSALMEIASLNHPELDYPPFEAGSPIPSDRPIFESLRERDVLVHHPYDAFDTTTQRLFAEAADDPDVVSIKATLYRMGRRSPVVDALIRAVEAGKEVDALVELKARFDEERNIEWVRKLERAGVHVVYGLVKLKTHSKLSMVVRQENGVVRRYVHVGTGNYNAATASLYTDLGLLSADSVLGADVNDLFNQLMGSSRPSQAGFRRLLVAPTTMLNRFLALIEREAEHAQAGRRGWIRVKINGLADTAIIEALYAASQAGVGIDLVVRGMCSLRPGVPGLSDRIRVVSILGRFLEHARIYHFHNGGDDEYFLGSADWRPRNLRRRVEVVTSVTDRAARDRLNGILEAELADPTAWELAPDGTYARRGDVMGKRARVESSSGDR